MIIRVAHSVCLAARVTALAAGLLSGLLSPAALRAEAQGGGAITGTVATKATGARPFRVTIDQRVCGNELPDESIVTDRAGGVANAVVTIAGVKARGAGLSLPIMNAKCRFSPRVQVVRPGAPLTTSSSDPILHTTNAQLEGGKVLFNVAVPVPGLEIGKTAPQAAGIVRLSCNIHPWMRGWLVVTEDVAAVTGTDGKFTLPDVPPGNYELRIWHESLKAAAQKVTVTAGKPVTVNFELK